MVAGSKRTSSVRSNKPVKTRTENPPKSKTAMSKLVAAFCDVVMTIEEYIKFLFYAISET